MRLPKPEKRNRARLARTCAVCGMAFEIPPCRIREGGGRACSRLCADKLRRTSKQYQCCTCNQTFSGKPSQHKYYKGANQYCSRACAYQGAVNTNRTKPITDKYGRSSRKDDINWRLAVRERDNYTCQRCGKQYPYIHTHHIAPRSRRPDLKYVVENGICLCGSCHLWCHHHGKEATALGLLSDASYERAKLETRQCSLCDSRHSALGLCKMHYKRLIKYGDPLLTKTHGGPPAEPQLVSPTHKCR
jgi:hypothetical protein